MQISVRRHLEAAKCLLDIGFSLSNRRTDQVYGVTRRQGDDVGARDGGLAGCFDLRLDGVDDLVPADGVDVGSGVLLAGERRRVIQEDGRVTTLCRTHICQWLSALHTDV